MGRRQCPFCGVTIPESATQCYSCREPLTEARLSGARPGAGGAEIRRGLLYMLLGAAAYYLTGDNSPILFEIPFAEIITQYLIPFLFLGGLGLVAYGLYRKGAR
jgi:hypothetical protein